MKSEIKQQWVEALCSREYKQTRGSLRDNTGFCCLGVLCDLHRKTAADAENWDLVPTEVLFETSTLDDKLKPLHYYGEYTVYLPPTVVNWAGLDTHDPEVLITTENAEGVLSEALSWLNDSGWTFEQIAELIDKNL